MLFCFAYAWRESEIERELLHAIMRRTLCMHVPPDRPSILPHITYIYIKINTDLESVANKYIYHDQRPTTPPLRLHASMYAYRSVVKVKGSNHAVHSWYNLRRNRPGFSKAWMHEGSKRERKRERDTLGGQITCAKISRVQDTAPAVITLYLDHVCNI